MNKSAPKMPKTVLQPIIESDNEKHSIKVFCAGLEAGEWRSHNLAHSLMAWLPDFALIPDESQDLAEDDAWERFRIAANKIYKTGFPEKRGEIGELVLHMLCRKYFGTYPSVSKIYFKSSGGEVVKGFDLVHTKYDDEEDEVEFWFGEAKFYTDGSGAVYEAIKSVKEHLEIGFLKSEKIAIYNKVIKSSPGHQKIDFLLHIDNSVDEMTKRMVIPILVTFDSESLAAATHLDQDYIEALSTEIKPLADKFLNDHEFDKLELRLLFVPTSTKKILLTKFDQIIQSMSEGNVE